MLLGEVVVEVVKTLLGSFSSIVDNVWLLLCFLFVLCCVGIGQSTLSLA